MEKNMPLRKWSGITRRFTIIWKPSRLFIFTAIAILADAKPRAIMNPYANARGSPRRIIRYRVWKFVKILQVGLELRSRREAEREPRIAELEMMFKDALREVYESLPEIVLEAKAKTPSRN